MMCMKFTILTYLITFLTFFIISCLRHSDADEYNLVKSQDLELKSVFSNNYGGQVNGPHVESKQFFDKHILCENNREKYERLLETVNNYIQRYVSLFLIMSGINDRQGQDSNEMITVDLEITISPEDLAYLQNFSKSSKELSVLRDLSRLDAILSEVIKRKEKSLFEHTSSFLDSSFYYLHLIIHHLLLLDLYDFTPFLIILLVTCFIYRFSSRKAYYVYLGIIINSMIFWDSVKLFRKRIKAAEIELETLKLQKIPAECDPANLMWYQRLMNFFMKDNCLEYYKKINSNVLDEVSLLQSILDTYGFYIIQTPFKVLGASVRDFTGEISASWPWPLQWIFNVPVSLLMSALIAFLFLSLCGKRLKFSFFGASVQVEDSIRAEETKTINKTGPRVIAGYRPLRTRAKRVLFRRSELNLAQNRKFSLKAAKSECAIDYKEDKDVQLFTAKDSEITKKQD